MTYGEYKVTAFAKGIRAQLDALKEKHWIKFDTEDMCAAIYFSFLSISGTELREDVDDQLTYYVKNYDSVLKPFLIQYFEVDEKEYLQWSYDRYQPTTSLFPSSGSSNIPGVTYKDNKDTIH